MNHFVKRISKREELNCLTKALEVARDHQLLLLPFNEEKKSLIGGFEKLLRLFLKPTYNHLKQRKRHHAIDLSKPLINVLMAFDATRKLRAR